MVDRNQLNYDKGSGTNTASEKFTDEKALIEADGRSDAETSFNPNEGGSILMSDGSRRSYKHLQQLNEGVYDSDRNGHNNEINLLRDAACWCNELELTNHQTDRTLHFLDNTSLNIFGTIDLETAVIALISYVANEDERWIQREGEYRQLYEDLDIEYSEFTSARRIIDEEM